MLAVEQLSKTHGNGVLALSNVSFTVAPGECIALIGRSGCGKSSLLRLIAGLDRPDSGAILVEQTQMHSPRQKVGVVFQEPRLLPWLRVEDNIAFGLKNLPKSERADRVDHFLERVGLAGYNRRWPRELSGGQAQRVAIARALAPKPRILLLDEPLSALDAFTRRDIQDHLLTLRHELRLTILLATHDIDEALLLADRVIVMAPLPGRIADGHLVNLHRPRKPESHSFAAMKAAVLASLGANGECI